jgi:hypothetical protein
LLVHDVIVSSITVIINAQYLYVFPDAHILTALEVFFADSAAGPYADSFTFFRIIVKYIQLNIVW